MKSHFNIVMDERDDGVKVWSAKCLRCDAMIVGELASAVPVFRALNHIPPNQVVHLNKQVHAAWQQVKRDNVPFVIPSPDYVVDMLPEHGLDSALRAHVEKCK